VKSPAPSRRQPDIREIDRKPVAACGGAEPPADVRPTQRRPLLPVQVGRRPEPARGGSQPLLKPLEAHEAPAASRASDSVCHRSPGGARR
jgi:hypothetical protein